MNTVKQLDLPWAALASLSFQNLVEVIEGVFAQHPDSLRALKHASLLPEEAAVYFYANRYTYYSLGWARAVELVLNALIRDRADLFYLQLFPDHNVAPLKRGPRHGVALISLFKSGTIFLNSKLAAATAKPFVKNGIFEAPFDGRTLPSWCDHIARYGGAWGSHSPASDETFQVAKTMGYDRLFVHLRNPFQATLSAYHYVEKFCRSTHADDAPWRDAAVKGLIDPAYPQLSEAERKRAVAQTIGLAQVDFINGWIDAEAADHGLSLGLGCHEEMVQDQSAYFDRLCTFYGFTHEQRQRFAETEGAGGHFRKGLTDEYLTAFDPTLIELLHSALNPAAFDRFPWLDPGRV